MLRRPSLFLALAETGTLEAQGAKTHVRIWTGKGFAGRVGKHNWSTPIYEEMMKTLQKPPAGV